MKQACLVFIKKQYCLNNFPLSKNIRIEFYLFVSHSVMKDRGSTYEFRKALRAIRNLHVDPLFFIEP